MFTLTIICEQKTRKAHLALKGSQFKNKKSSKIKRTLETDCLPVLHATQWQLCEAFSVLRLTLRRPHRQRCSPILI